LKFREILKAWLPVALWLALMFFGSTNALSADHTSRILTPLLRWLKPDISLATIAQVHLFVRKGAHVTEYAILAGLFLRALHPSIGGFWWRAAAAHGAILLLAPVDEFHQSFVPSRAAATGDVFIDYSGAIAGVLLCGVTHFARTRHGRATTPRNCLRCLDQLPITPHCSLLRRLRRAKSGL
jgi:VanZ family protein